MKKNLLLLLAALLIGGGTAMGWGRTGHDAIAAIAECNLTPRAKKTLSKYLDNRSIVYYSSWMDEVRYTPPYRHTSAWHGALIDAQGAYLPSERGDAVACVEDAVQKLRDYRHLDDSTVRVSIKFLVHLLGDMHCPSHTKGPEYKDFEFFLEEKKYAFHSFWDSPVLELNHRWGFSEYAAQLNRATRAQKRSIAGGTPRQWVEQSYADCRVMHEWLREGERYDRKQSKVLLMQAQQIADRQVEHAGYRLARILNELFG